MKKPAVRVLVVDDFQPFREWVCLKLAEEVGFEVVGEAADTEQAFEKARELIPDLILLDIGLSGVNGLEAQTQLSRLNLPAEIVFLTEYSDRGAIECALSNGAGGYILKSDAERELLPALQAVLNGADKVLSSGCYLAVNRVAF